MPIITVVNKREINVPEYGTCLDIDQLIKLVKDSGSHFFDKDTMRFFRSRVDDYTYAGKDGWYFVTSEKHVAPFVGINEPRLYTVRRLSIAPTGDDLRLYELEGFQQYSTLNKARTAAKHAAKTGVKVCQDCQLRLSNNERCSECAERAARKAV